MRAIINRVDIIAAVIDGHMVIHCDSTGSMSSFDIVGEAGRDDGTQRFDLYHGTHGRRSMVAYDGGIAELFNGSTKYGTARFIDTAAPMDAEESDMVECMRVLSHGIVGAHSHI